MQKTLTVGEATKLSGYTRQQLYNLLRTGKVKAQRRGWEYWVYRGSLAAYCDQQGKSLSKAE